MQSIFGTGAEGVAGEVESGGSGGGAGGSTASPAKLDRLASGVTT